MYASMSVQNKAAIFILFLFWMLYICIYIYPSGLVFYGLHYSPFLYIFKLFKKKKEKKEDDLNTKAFFSVTPKVFL